MSTLLKDLYSSSFYTAFSNVAGEVIPSFDKKVFTRLIFDRDWESRELKERMKHTSLVLHRFLPGDFGKSAKIIVKIITALRRHGIKDSGLEYMFLADYIETFGIHHYEASVKAIEMVTQFTSCEFAVRPFIIQYGDKMIQQMIHWSKHESHHVRRLASEGTRPRLPWAMAIPRLKKDPAPILPLLENLKNDPSAYVRRSVANSLNDISKDNPDTVIAIARQWKGAGKETDEIIKHGCRTLLKQAHPEILKYYGLNGSNGIKLSGFRILTPRLKIGDSLAFSFTLQNTGLRSQTIRLEYAIYYRKQNGIYSKKIFKISERLFQPQTKYDVLRKQSFKIITTRKFYTGLHKLSVIINGQERTTGKFELTG